MKTLVIAGLLGVALVLAGCGGANDSDTASGSNESDAAEDTTSLGLSGRFDDPDQILCNRLRERSPQKWWTSGDFIGQDLVDTCLNVFQATIVGDCLVVSNGSCPGADLRGADLRGAALGEMNLTGANLTGANLSNAFLTFAKFDRADLTDTNFSNAQMYGVNLARAVIEGANFNGAQLQDATWVDGRKCARNSPQGRCS